MSRCRNQILQWSLKSRINANAMTCEMRMATAILQGTWLSSFSAVRRKGSVSYMMTWRLLSVQSEPSFSLMADPRVTIATAAFGRVDCYYTDLNVSSGLIIDLTEEGTV